MQKRRLTTIFFIVFVDVLGFGLILPLLPYYAKTFGASFFVTGLLGSAYAVASIVGTPVLGRMSDRFGRRPILLVSIFGSFVGFVLLGVANTLWLLFLSRVIDGVTAGNFSVAQSYISDVTTAEERARGLGLTGAAFGLGFIIGPTVGGLLSRFGYGAVGFAAAFMTLVNMGLVFFLLPESLSDERKAELAAQPRSGITLAKLIEAFHRPRFGPALVLRAGFWFAFAIFQTTFALWGIARLHLTPTSTGLILAYVGVMSVIVQLLLIKPLTARFSEGRLALVSLGITAVALFAWGFSPNIPVLLVVLTPLSLSVAVQNTIASSLLSKSVQPWEIGGAFGLAGGLQNFGSAVAPALGGALLQGAGFWAPGVVSGLVAAGLVPFVYVKFVRGGGEAAPAAAEGEVAVPDSVAERLAAEADLGPEIGEPAIGSGGQAGDKPGR